MESHPLAEGIGQTSKIKRYYWREILKREYELLSDKLGATDVDVLLSDDPEIASLRKDASAQALIEIKSLYERNPKYTFAQRQPLPDVISENNVEVVNLKGVYIKGSKSRKAKLRWNDETLHVEDFVARNFAQEGFQALALESVPFHVLFGVFLWPLIQDVDDDRVRMAAFGDRVAYEAGEDGETIWCNLPDDFGSEEYGIRKREEIDLHFAELLLPCELTQLFDYWLKPSEQLRQYLWAHRDSDIDTARKLTFIIPSAKILEILRYLVDSYWKRYVGWPDLLLFRGEEFFFAEVKSSNDKLSDVQIQWIRDNHQVLKLPYKLVKVHRSS